MVLRCAHVLLSAGGRAGGVEGEEGKMGSVDEAERYLLQSGGGGQVGSALQPSKDRNYRSENGFVLTDGHRQLLWLLERHVLSVAKYSQFDTGYAGRGYEHPPQNLCREN